MSKYRTERRKTKKIMTDWNDSNFIKIRYVRYADDFLLGIAGPKEFVVKMRAKIMVFVNLNLKLKLTGGKITHIKAGKVKFLGMMISAVFFPKSCKRFNKRLEKINRIKNKIKLQRKILKKRKLKVVQMALKKALKNDSKTKIVDKFNILDIVSVLRKWISLDHDSSKEFVNTYRQFLEAIMKTIILVPDELMKNLEVIKRLIDKWKKNFNLLEENPKKYKKLISCYDVTFFQISAPLVEIRDKLREKSIISKSNKPKAISRLIHVLDNKIVRWYKAVSRSLLSYYGCCHNFSKVKNYVDYMVRWSAINTLARKYKSSCKKIISKYTKDLIIKDKNGFVLISFMNSYEIKTIKKQFKKNMLYDVVEKTLN